MLFGPFRAEGEGQVIVDVYQRGGVAEVGGIVVALLHLRAPVGGIGSFLGIIDGELVALDGRSREFRLLGGETGLDVEDLGGFAHDGELVAGRPGPGQGGLFAGTAAGGVVRDGNRDGDKAIRRREFTLRGLVAGEEESRE